jgi:pimeloyl-ACP methyl ester carboxylesterase
MPHPTTRFIVALLLAASGLSVCAQTASCKSLHHLQLPASSIALPTTGVTITSASEHHQGDVPYCKVMGRIHPIDPAADDIRFELNLPANWNAKALQFGGGTIDGWLGATNGRGRTAVGLKSQTTPLGRGYATFGSDGGHHRNYFPFPDAVNTLNAKFARNLEMRRNYAGESVKKTHDAVIALITRFYGHAPARMYFIGGSTGGREALIAAERFPADYDGVLAAYAAWDQIELDLQFMRTAQALYAHGGFLGFAQTRLINHAVQKACDAQDGLHDGIISDPAACHVEPTSLRCPDGRHHHGCLSDQQVHTLEVFTSPQRTSVPVSHGIDSIPGYNALAGADLASAVGLLHFQLHHPILLFSSFGYIIGDDVTRNFLSAGHHYNSLHFDTTTAGGPYQSEVIANATLLDATDTNLQPFFAHGGKLILVHGSADTIIPTNSTIDFYQRLQATLGPAAVSASARLYIVPGLGHGFGKFNGGFDTIGALDAWADRNVAPANLTVTDNHSGRSRPLCAWPDYARYTGSGGPNTAASFTCTAP